MAVKKVAKQKNDEFSVNPLEYLIKALEERIAVLECAFKELDERVNFRVDKLKARLPKR